MSHGDLSNSIGYFCCACFMLTVLYHRTCVFFDVCCLFNLLAVGWKFWIPAASINFYCVPIQAQVREHEGTGGGG